MKLPTIDPNQPFFANNSTQIEASRASLQATLETNRAQTAAATAGLQARGEIVKSAAKFGMNVLSGIQTIRNTWEQTQLAAAKVAAARDMNNFNLELLKNRDYTKWQEMYQTFDQQMKDTYAAQLGDKGLADQFSNWYTGEASKQKLKVVGQAVQQMVTDSRDSTKNTVDSAVQQGDFAGVDSAIQTALDHNLFSPAEAESMKSQAYHDIRYNQAFNVATTMTEAGAAAWIRQQVADKKISEKDGKQLITDTSPIIKKLEVKKWDGNYSVASNGILNGSSSPTYDDLAGMLRNDNIDLARYNDLIALKKAKENQSTKADPTYEYSTQKAWDAAINGTPVPSGLPGWSNYAGKILSMSDFQQHVMDIAPLTGVSVAKRYYDQAQTDNPIGLSEGTKVINDAFAEYNKKGKNIPEDRRLAALTKFSNEYRTNPNMRENPDYAAQMATTYAKSMLSVPQQKVTTTEGQTSLRWSENQIQDIVLPQAFNGDFKRSPTQEMKDMAQAAVQVYQPKITDFMGAQPGPQSGSFEGKPEFDYGGSIGYCTYIPSKKDKNGQYVASDPIPAHWSDAANGWVPFSMPDKTAAQLKLGVQQEQAKISAAQRTISENEAKLTTAQKGFKSTAEDPYAGMYAPPPVDKSVIKTAIDVQEANIAESNRAIEQYRKVLKERGIDY